MHQKQLKQYESTPKVKKNIFVQKKEALLAKTMPLKDIYMQSG